MWDGAEVDQGSNPLYSGDGGHAPASSEIVPVLLTIGDPSGSESEMWAMQVGDISLRAPGFGTVISEVFLFRRGQVYPVSVQHLGTKLDKPDYDYYAAIEFAESYDGAAVDPSGMLGDHGESSVNFAAGKQAQMVTLPTLMVRSVEFGTSLTRDLIDDRTANGVPFPRPHWSDQDGDGTASLNAGEHWFPAAFAAGTQVAIEDVEIGVMPPDTDWGQLASVLGEVRLEGLSVAAGQGFTAMPTLQPDVLTASGLQSMKVLSGVVTQTPQPLPPVIRAFNGRASTLYDVHWQVVFGEGEERTVAIAGASHHQLYVLPHASPQLPNVQSPQMAPFGLTTSQLLHTTVDIACSGGDGIEPATVADADLVSAVWQEFAARDVKRAIDGVPLAYYASWTTGNTTATELVNLADGQCLSWAQLFADCVFVAGITSGLEWLYVQPNPQAGVAFRFMLVPDWDFSGNNIFGNNPILGVGVTANVCSWSEFSLVGGFFGSTPGSYAFHPAAIEAVDLPGVEGQNTTNPTSLFRNHQVIQFGSDVFDPSYGRHYASQSLFVGSSVSRQAGVDSMFFDETTHSIDLDQNGVMEMFVPAIYLAVDTSASVLADYDIEAVPLAP